MVEGQREGRIGGGFITGVFWSRILSMSSVRVQRCVSPMPRFSVNPLFTYLPVHLFMALAVFCSLVAQIFINITRNEKKSIPSK